MKYLLDFWTKYNLALKRSKIKGNLGKQGKRKHNSEHFASIAVGSKWRIYQGPVV